MSNLAEHVRHTIQAGGLFCPGQAILIAVSGGLDSMGLLHVLHELSGEQGWRLSVAHLNHQLRGRSSDADERLVRGVARRLKLPVVISRADVRKLARGEKLSLEMAARQARHTFLARTAAQAGIRVIALAHQADDQLELFFIRLLRGSGGEGLAGMKWRNPSPNDGNLALVRPFLDLPKEVLRAYARERKIEFREDASNAQLDILRNRIRHELLPLLRRRYQPALHKTIPRLMDILGEEAGLAAGEAARWLEQLSSDEPSSGPEGMAMPPFSDGSKVRDRGRTKARAPRGAGRLQFEELPVAVQRRGVQAQLLARGVPPDFDLIEHLRLKADQPINLKRHPGAGTQAPLSAVRDRRGVVRVRETLEPGFNCDFRELTLAGRRGAAVFGGVLINWQVLPNAAGGRVKRAPGREIFDAGAVGRRIILRYWRPGDRFRPIGMTSAVKLQDLFVNLKVPRANRRKLVVAATARGELFWVQGFRMAERFKLQPGTNRRLQWDWRGA